MVDTKTANKGSKLLQRSALSRQHSLFNISNQATQELWESLRTESERSISSKYLLDFLNRQGLHIADDPRFTTLAEALSPFDEDCNLPPELFAEATKDCKGLIRKAVKNELRVPNFGGLVKIIQEVYEAILPVREGENAQYIPELKNADPEKFAISFCSVDGQQFSIGDSNDSFCIQSCSKPLSYLLALREFGAEYLHGSVGHEPSGHAFNEIILKDISTRKGRKHSIPHNPMINAGAIMTCSMVYPDMKRQERLDRVMDFWRSLSAGVGDCIGFDNAMYLSESGSADQNWCLAYMMKEFNAFPKCFNERPDYKKALEDTLELYFSICSVRNTCRGMSVMAATLANGGVNPLTSERVVKTESVRCALPLMLSSGMYDYSGQWAFDVGVPAKSGVGGCVFLVIPNVGGISIFSPRLDGNGNSVRGVQVATELVNRVQMHNFEVFSGLKHLKMNLSAPRYSDECRERASVMFAASEGDLSSIVINYSSGSDMCMADYDGRTPLHVAASEGHAKIVQFLVDHYPSDRLDQTDRWGNSPFSEAIHFHQKECADILRGCGFSELKNVPIASAACCSDDPAKSSMVVLPPSKVICVCGGACACVPSKKSPFCVCGGACVCVPSKKSPRVLVAAAAGDVDELVKLKASGAILSEKNYDHRTALHLGACHGHVSVLKYVIINCEVDRRELVQTLDRWGNSAMEDALRYGNDDCADYLREWIGGE